MDLSKLPKLSDTRNQLPPVQKGPPDEPTLDESTNAKIPNFQTGVPNYQEPMTPRSPSPGVGLAETWLSIGVGAFLLLFYPRFLQWASSRVFHTHFDEFIDQATNAVVPYQTLAEFWSDLGPTLLGIVLIVDGLLLFTQRKALLMVAMVLTFVSTGLNAVWVVVSYPKYGLAPISFLAAVFGGFILSTQWVSYQRLRHITWR